MPNQPLELYFVLCHRFHGATVLALLLNNHSRVSSLGDLLPRTEYDQICGCGRNVSRCPFWLMIDNKFKSMRHSGCRSTYPDVPLLFHTVWINETTAKIISLAALHTTSRVWHAFSSAAQRFATFYVDFINTINEYNDTSVFVNGQKSLKSVLSIKSILGDMARINIIHVTRDPRAFYCSELKDDPNIGLENSAKRWKSYHSRVLNLVQPLCNARYLNMRYEDLCDRPEATLERIFDFIGVEAEPVFYPPEEHHLMGNASMRRFDGTMHKNLKWQNSLSQAEQERCLTLTLPLSRKFGYYG